MLPLTIALLLTVADPAGMERPVPEGAAPAPRGGSLYCQTPIPFASLNSSTGWGIEIADDVPASLGGSSFNVVKLWVAEWQIFDPADWVDPEAIWIRLYDTACPPSQIAYAEYRIPWSEIETSLWWPGNPWVVYEARISLPTVETIPPTSISIGVQVENSWGTGGPYPGFMVIDENDVVGCPVWRSAPLLGIPRWTEFGLDLGFCLEYEPATSVADDHVRDASWGLLKAMYR